MTRLPSLLVAVDFSDAAARAYVHALELAEAAGTGVRLLHVVEQRDREDLALARDWLARLQVRECDLLILPGTPWVQIVRQCEALRPFLLVVGSHGRGGYQPLTPGSTTARLLVRSPVPLVVVPSGPAAATQKFTEARTRTAQRNSHG